jgi:hypothetical protein
MYNTRYQSKLKTNKMSDSESDDEDLATLRTALKDSATSLKSDESTRDKRIIISVLKNMYHH